MAKTGVGSTSAKSTPQKEAKPREVGITDRVVLLCSTSWKIDTRMKSTERPFLSPIAHSFILSVCYCYPVVENATGAYFGLLCASLIVQCPPTSAFRFSFPYRVAVGAVCRGVVLCCLALLDNPSKRVRERGVLFVYKRFYGPELLSGNVLLEAIVRLSGLYVRKAGLVLEKPVVIHRIYEAFITSHNSCIMSY